MLILDNISGQTTTARNIPNTGKLKLVSWEASTTFMSRHRKLSLTSPELGFETMKYPTKPLNTTINGTVTNVQNGQHGPATIIGLPSFFSTRKNMDPTRRAQQQQQLLKFSATVYGLQQSPKEVKVDLRRRRRRWCCCCCCSCSHLMDTAYLNCTRYMNS